MTLWILDGHTPVEEPNVDKWGRWMANTKRHVAITAVPPHYVSTVFLGVDHNFTGKGPPILFETMVFPGCHRMDRYATWEEAVAGHERMVERVAREIVVPPP